jgi:hypothetical protein|tara:strand:+ start:703 stop:885 length:183 start_codon:yes stop_codon:yes gene_type:complete
VRKKKKMLPKRRRKIKKIANKSGKTQERGTILVRHRSSHREQLHKVTSEVSSKQRLQMNA